MESAYRTLLDKGLLEKGCPLCTRPSLKEFTHWKVVLNDFPYDRIADTHHMIIPRRHASEDEIMEEEWREYAAIKAGFISDTYEYIMESTHRRKTIPAHFHVHLLTIK